MVDVKFKLGFVSFEIRWWITLVIAVASVVAFWLPEALLPALAYVSLLLHEVGHATVQRVIFGVGSTIRIFGIIRGRTTSVLPRPATPRERVIFALSGPLIGIAFGLALTVLAAALALGWPFVAGGGAIIVLHVFNILPIKDGSDGAVIKQALGKADL